MLLYHTFLSSGEVFCLSSNLGFVGGEAECAGSDVSMGSTSQTEPKKIVDPAIVATSLWLVEELKNRGVEKPYVTKTSKGWQVKDGNQLIGRPRSEWMDERSVEAVDCCFRIPGSVTIELDPASWHPKAKEADVETKTKKNVKGVSVPEETTPEDRYPELFEVIGLVTSGQRAVVKSKFKEDGLEAYPVFAEAIGATVERVACKTKKGKKAEKGATRNKLSGAPLSGSLMAYNSKQAEDKMKQWAKKQDQQSMPWFKAKSMGVPKECFDIVLVGRDLNLCLTLRAAVNGRSPMMTGKAYALGTSQWTILHKLMKPDSGYTMGAARLVWDDDRGRFQLKVSYSYPRPETKQGKDTLVVCPGLNSLFTMWFETARYVGQDDSSSYVAHQLQFTGQATPNRPNFGIECDSNVPYLEHQAKNGGNIETILQAKVRFDDERASRNKHLNHQGRGARGHGRNRFLKIKAKVADKEARYVETYCEQQAAYIAKYASGLQLTSEGWVQTREPFAEVLIHDWSTHTAYHPNKRIQRILRRFPTAQLRDKIVWALTKAGIDHRALKVGITLCPSCQEGKMAYDDLSQLHICKKCHQQVPKGHLVAWSTFRAGSPSKFFDYDSVSANFRGLIRSKHEHKTKAIEDVRPVVESTDKPVRKIVTPTKPKKASNGRQPTSTITSR